MDYKFQSIVSLLDLLIEAADPENLSESDPASIRQAENMASEIAQILSALKEPVILVSNNRRPVLVNPAAKRLLGLDPTGRSIQKILKKLKLTAMNGVPVTYETFLSNMPWRGMSLPVNGSASLI